MQLTTLRLHNFRNHTDSTFEFGGGANLFLGDNGQGKTNVLEAISYLCLTKSFYASSDSIALKLGAELFEVEGTFITGETNEHVVRVAYDKQQSEKAYFINRKSVEPFSSVIGKFPVVICSPEHNPVTAGGPDERRRFCDFVVSQASPVYFKALLEYRRVLKQRNKILLDAKLNGSNPARLLESWDEQLVQHGSALTYRRKLFIDDFAVMLRAQYHHLIGEEEEPAMEYEPFQERFATDAECKEMMKKALAHSKTEEARVGATLVGPHRDEFVFKINGLDLRKYGSQGQHKTFLVGLKLGEFHYLKNLCSEQPLLLLDDIFSELDERRSERLLDFVGTISQTFITSTTMKWFEPFDTMTERNKKFYIREGAVAENG
ncbi:MAG: DNA replication and repair protein RecF [Bacteroidetes bacterium]|nr:MAG: DNA replication and repair protein RecF [Bacteroidota bacterium]